MGKVWIKGIPWPYETGGIAVNPEKGDYIHLPNGKFFLITSIFLPYDTREVKWENIPEGKKIYYLLECD